MTEANIKLGDLVLKGDALDAAQQATPKRKAAAPQFKCVVSSGADFVVKRTTATTSRLLVMLVSQEQYYVKDERTGKLDMLTEKTLSSFFQGLGDDGVEINCSWLAIFSNSKKKREALVSVIRAPGFKQAATSGLVNFDKYSSGIANAQIATLAQCAKTNASYVKHIGNVASKLDQRKKEMLTANIEPLLSVCETYGLDHAREFVNRFVECAAFEQADGSRNANLLYGLPDLLAIVPTRDGIVAHAYRLRQEAYGEPIIFQFDKFCDYLFEQSAREGFTDLSHWIMNWKDALLLQLFLSGKIAHKYPANLLSTRQILSTEATRMQKEIDKARWAKAEATMRDFDFAPSAAKYLITHPVTPDDMRAEAVAQSNCLAGYVDKVVAGRCMIFFARKAESPEKSLLTIEVNTKTMELAQVKARFNHEADDDSMAFVARWCCEKGISLGAYAARTRLLQAA